MKETLDFIVIGAQKAGTTSLFEHLRQHPQLSLPAAKELPFFSHEAMRARGWQDYMRKAFAFADPDTRWGTATPQYMIGGLWEEPNPAAGREPYDERTVPLRIRERLPEARLIAILRDPAERAHSHHRMVYMNRLERRPFEQAIDQLLSPRALEEARREPRETTGYVAWGEYGRILAGYFEVFAPEQILVLFTSELESEPGALLARVYRFLEVDAGFAPRDAGRRYRVGGERRRLQWLGTHSRNPWTAQRALAQNTAARSLWHALPERRRRQIDHAFSSFSYRLDLWNRRAPADSPACEEATLQRLRAHYADDGKRLTTLLGAPPPWQR
jgi:sulfotransferase family protein